MITSITTTDWYELQQAAYLSGDAVDQDVVVIREKKTGQRNALQVNTKCGQHVQAVLIC